MEGGSDSKWCRVIAGLYDGRFNRKMRYADIVKCLDEEIERLKQAREIFWPAYPFRMEALGRDLVLVP
jgi:hypothetical protein